MSYPREAVPRGALVLFVKSLARRWARRLPIQKTAYSFVSGDFGKSPFFMQPGSRRARYHGATVSCLTTNTSASGLNCRFLFSKTCDMWRQWSLVGVKATLRCTLCIRRLQCRTVARPYCDAELNMVWLPNLLVFVPYSCVALDVTLGDAAMNRY